MLEVNGVRSKQKRLEKLSAGIAKLFSQVFELMDVYICGYVCTILAF